MKGGGVGGRRRHEHCQSHGWRGEGGGRPLGALSDVILTSADTPANGEEGSLSQYQNFLSS